MKQKISAELYKKIVTASYHIDNSSRNGVGNYMIISAHAANLVDEIKMQKRHNLVRKRLSLM